MHRFVFAAVAAASFLLVALASGPSLAITMQQKKATCNFGADDQKLAGHKRARFIARCMSNKNDPRGPTPASPPPKS